MERANDVALDAMHGVDGAASEAMHKLPDNSRRGPLHVPAIPVTVEVSPEELPAMTLEQVFETVDLTVVRQASLALVWRAFGIRI